MNQPHASHVDGQTATQAPEDRPTLADRVRALKLPNSVTATPRGWRRWLPWLLCLLLAATTFYFGFAARAGKPGATAPSSLPQIATGGDAAPPAPGSVVLEAGGYIVPVRKVRVSPKVGGQVEELFIRKEGDFFPKGAALARLEATEYRYEFERAKAAWEQAQAMAGQAKAKYDEMEQGNRPEEIQQAAASHRKAVAQYEQLKSELQRLKLSGRATTADELERMESRVQQAKEDVEHMKQAFILMEKGAREERRRAAKAEYDHAQAQVNQFKAEMDRAKYRLDNCSVLSPVNGTILIKQAEVGDTVRPEAFSNGLSASLCEMADLRDLEVDIDISERDLYRIEPGQKCTVHAEAYPKLKHTGWVAREMPFANRSKASVSVRVHIDPDAAPARTALRRTAAAGRHRPRDCHRPDLGRGR